jgi:hypothetical protein
MRPIHIGGRVRHPDCAGQVGRVVRVLAGGTRLEVDFSETSGIFDAAENFTVVAPSLPDPDAVRGDDERDLTEPSF